MARLLPWMLEQLPVIEEADLAGTLSNKPATVNRIEDGEEPRLGHNARQAAIFDAMADEFLKPIPADIVARTTRIAGMARLRPGQAVLDVGTGAGVMIPYFLQAMAGRVVACDLASEMLERARLRFPKDVLFVQRDVVDLPVEIGQFDRVICNAVFANFYDQRRAMIAIRRLLRSNGLLVISHPMGRKFVLQLRASNPGMVRNELPPRGDLLNLCKATGFRLLRMVDEEHLYAAIVRPINP